MAEVNSHINQRDASINNSVSRKKDSTIRVLFKFYKLVSAKWRNKKKYEENKSIHKHKTKLESKDGGSVHPQMGIEEVPGVCCFRYNDDGIDGETPMHPGRLSKRRSLDNCGFSFLSSPFSRISSRRSPSPFSKSASRRSPSTEKQSRSYRSRSGKSTELSGYPGAFQGPDLTRNVSRMSPAPIMFSNSTGLPVKPPAVEKNLECTLEELCFGCTKSIKITRDAVITSSGQLIQEEEVLSIEVKPGWKKGAKITFEGKGNHEEVHGTQQADVIFVIAEKHHHFFRRDDDDLHLVVEIPLVKALTGCTITVPLLGGEMMDLSIDDEIIHHGYERMIEGQGMPIQDHEGGARGNLKLMFLVEFPTELTDEQRSNVLHILEDC